jgi:hypothetical protein
LKEEGIQRVGHIVDDDLEKLSPEVASEFPLK